MISSETAIHFLKKDAPVYLKKAASSEWLLSLLAAYFVSFTSLSVLSPLFVDKSSASYLSSTWSIFGPLPNFTICSGCGFISRIGLVLVCAVNAVAIASLAVILSVLVDYNFATAEKFLLRYKIDLQPYLKASPFALPVALLAPAAVHEAENLLSGLAGLTGMQLFAAPAILLNLARRVLNVPVDLLIAGVLCISLYEFVTMIGRDGRQRINVPDSKTN